MIFKIQRRTQNMRLVVKNWGGGVNKGGKSVFDMQKSFEALNNI